MSKCYLTLLFICLFGLAPNNHAYAQLNNVKNNIQTFAYLMAAAKLQMAMVYLSNGMPKPALKNLEEVLVTIERDEGRDAWLYGMAYWYKGIALSHIDGRDEEARKIIDEAFLIIKKNKIDNAVLYQTVMFTGAAMFKSQNQIERSYQTLETLVETVEHDYGKKSQYYVSSLALAAAFYTQQPEKTKDAVRCNAEADSLAALYGFNAVHFFTQRGLADFYTIKANYYQNKTTLSDSAKIYFNIAKKIYTQLLNDKKYQNYKSEDNIITVLMKAKGLQATVYQNLANIYYFEKDYANAEIYYNKVINFKYKIKPQGFATPISFSMPGVKNNLAICYRDQGKYKKAEAMFLKAIYQSRNQMYSNVDVEADEIRISANLAVSYYMAGKLEKGEALLAYCISELYQGFKKSNAYIVDSEIETAKNPLKTYLHAYYANNEKYNYHNPKHDVFLFQVEMHTKGLRLQNILAVKTSVDSLIEYQNFIANEDYIKQLKAKLYQKDGTPYKEKLLQMKALEAENTALNRRLIEKSNEFKAMDKFWQTSHQDIQAKMPENSIVIEFTDTYFANNTADFTIAAFVFTKNIGPKYIKVINFPALNAILQSNTTTLRGNSAALQTYIQNLYNGAISHRLYTQIIQPLFPNLPPEGTKIFIARTTGLHTLALEHILMPDGKRFGEKYDLNYVSSTRTLAEEAYWTQQKEKPTSALLVGNISLSANTVETVSAATADTRGGRQQMPHLASPELYALDSLLRKQNIVPTLLTQAGATEKAFAEAVADKQFVLLSTHAMVVTPSDTLNAGQYFKNIAENPDDMQRALFTMAGYNRSFSPKNLNDTPSDQNGAFTAAEVATTNMRNCLLVFAAACETGKGAENSEGVFGVVRGLKQAGAQTLILSYHEVNDEATTLMVKLFAQFYFDKTLQLTPKQALAKAQQAMQTRNDRAGNPYTVYHWGSFYVLD